MNVKFYIGTIRYCLNLPMISQKDEEMFQKFSFPKVDIVSEFRVSFRAVEKLPEIEGEEVYNSIQYRIFSDKQREYRQYYRFSVEESPIFAVSRIEGQKIDIWYLPSRVFWGHPDCVVWNLLHLESVLLSKGGIILHSVYYRSREDAILFTAPSGTGKTTHAKLWNQLGKGRIINGDKTLLQKIDGRWCACGYIFHGSAPECENVITPLKSIVIIRQAHENRVVELSLMQKIKYLYKESTVNIWNKQAVEKVWDLLLDIASSVQIVLLECTKEQEAAKVMYNYIYGE